MADSNSKSDMIRMELGTQRFLMLLITIYDYEFGNSKISVLKWQTKIEKVAFFIKLGTYRFLRMLFTIHN